MQLNFEQIPKVCINLKRNVARREGVISEFNKNNLNVQFFDAIDKLNIKVPEVSVKLKESNAAGILACAMSHIEVIKLAQKNNWPTVCVFEDDVVFCKEFKDRINYLENLPEFDFDILCLGGHFSNKEISGQEAERTQWQNVYKINKMNGTYALIFTEKVYDFILRNWNFNFGADEFFSNHVYTRFKTYAFVPFLVGCGKNLSDVTGQDWEYENIKWHFNHPEQNMPGTWQRSPEQDVKPVIENYLDLQDCTFIIPVKIESEDRAFNFVRCIQHLCNTLKTNIIIKECDRHSPVLELLKKVDAKQCKVQHIFEMNDSAAFHRTRLLNEMLVLVKTPVVVNYDIDCLLRPETYILARNKITEEGYDLIYPYGQDEDQIQITFEDKQDYKTNLFDQRFHSRWGSYCGHAQFFKTESYRNGFMENENFISYAPEDRERCERFIKLGYKVEWLKGHQIFHLEHSRGVNSSTQNPHFGDGEALYNRLHNMSKQQLIEYYKKQPYINKYK